MFHSHMNSFLPSPRSVDLLSGSTPAYTPVPSCMFTYLFIILYALVVLALVGFRLLFVFRQLIVYL